MEYVADFEEMYLNNSNYAVYSLFFFTICSVMTS